MIAPAAREGRIKLDVVVTDPSGAPVANLGAGDFTLLDNNQPSSVLSFRAVDGVVQKAERPVEIILLIDGVNLEYPQVAAARQGLERFFRQNDGQLAQPVSLFFFTIRGLDGQSRPSLDGNALAAEVMKIDQSASKMGTRDSLAFSVTTLMAIADNEAKKPGRKLLVWIGPGWRAPDPRQFPTSAKQRQIYFDWIVQLSTRLREARTAVYSVSLGNGLANLDYESHLKGVNSAVETDSANLALKVLVNQTGGRVLGPDNDLAGQINRCIRDASPFYTLSFDPPHTTRANEFHDLKVQIDKPRLKARTYTGYYNSPAPEVNTASKPSSDHTSAVLEANRVESSTLKPVTVEQLDQLLKSAHGRPDAEQAKLLSGLVLTERLSSTKLSTWKASLSGTNAQQALVVLADESAFLPPPAVEIPADTPPDLAVQRKMMGQVIGYLSKTLPKLPNFFATRLTEHYQETLPKSPRPKTEAPGVYPLHLAESLSATVLYRDGHEVVDAEAKKGKQVSGRAAGLVTSGTFGPILTVVIKDSASSQLSWSHWERVADANLAVFKFSVPSEKSHYSPRYGSSSFNDQSDDLQQPTGYRGEITIDPATGTVLRLILKANFEAGSSMVRADVMVEYDQVEIGGKPYFCPTRSVSIARGPSYLYSDFGTKVTLGPAMTMLNDVAFVNYHQFRAEIRVLPADGAPTKDQ